jgi:uncharacterized membrane protein YeiB
VFDPWRGPLATRFAAVFVTLAGMGITLLTRRSRASGDRLATSADRWTLVRRGVLLYAFGFFLNWVWDGTILVYYGAFFIVGALLFTLRSRWLVVVGVTSALIAAAVRWYAVQHQTNGHDVTWLLQRPSVDPHSPKEQLLETFIRGTHPLFPWLVFLCLGMVLGRMLPFSPLLRMRLATAGFVALAAGYLARHVLPMHDTLKSTTPFDRGVLYTLTAVGSTLLAVSLLGWLCERYRTSAAVTALATAGRTTLTLYVAHVLVFDLLVDRWRWVRPGGLGTSLTFALAFWVVAVAAAVLWHRRFALGPLEWVYRRFSNAPA